MQRTRVVLNPGEKVPGFHILDDTLWIFLNNPEFQPETLIERQYRPPLLKQSPFSGHRVCLAVPARRGDSRWRSIHMTASSLFLGSALARNGYDVRIAHPRLPDLSIPVEAVTTADLLGITLFEDLLPDINSWLDAFKAPPPEWIAVGGPMVTLNPLAAVTHFPHGRIWVRGEGEGIFPSILNALKSTRPSALAPFPGLLVIGAHGLISSSFDRINRPDPLAMDEFDFSFVHPSQWREGVELNISRGCKRSCVFCSRVQGRRHRRLSMDTLERMLEKINKSMDLNTEDPLRAININDDDILQDPDYASEVFHTIKSAGFRLWGIQTSLSSIVSGNKVDTRVLALLSDIELYIDAPLVWLGTDTFSVSRGKRLGKYIPDAGTMSGILDAFQQRGIRNYHYWIISDYASGWPELSREIERIRQWWKTYSLFHILPHAPFLVPYPSTALYRLLFRTGRSGQIRFRKHFHSRHRCLEYALVDRVESPWEMLNRMLLAPEGEAGESFIGALKHRDSKQVLEIAFQYLRQERLRMQEGDMHQDSLARVENRLNRLLEIEFSE